MRSKFISLSTVFYSLQVVQNFLPSTVHGEVFREFAQEKRIIQLAELVERGLTMPMFFSKFHTWQDLKHILKCFSLVVKVFQFGRFFHS